MTASAAAIELIKLFESLRLEAYRCPAGVWTVGWGHTAGVRAGMRIGEDQAEVIRTPLTQGQYDALVSLCFNLAGAQRLGSIAPHLVAKTNRGDWAGAAGELLDIDRANGQVLPGLVRRREAERKLFVG